MLEIGFVIGAAILGIAFYAGMVYGRATAPFSRDE